MSSPKQRETVHKRANTTEGHYVMWTISARDLHVMRTWDFAKNYRTFCKTAASSWDFKMSFPQVGKDGTASMSVTLTRRDASDIELGAAVWVDVSDSRQKEIYPRKTFRQVGMLPGNEIIETVELKPNSNMGGAINRDVIIIVTLMVSSCHPKEEDSSDDGH